MIAVQIGEKFDVDAGAPPPKHVVGVMVLCAVEDAAKAPTCDALAKTYVGAVRLGGPSFYVEVRAQGETPLCHVDYTANGDTKTGAPPAPGSPAPP